MYDLKKKKTHRTMIYIYAYNASVILQSGRSTYTLP